MHSLLGTNQPNHPDHLVPYVLRQLEQHNIRTVCDLIQTDTQKLRSITNLPPDQINQLKKDLIEQFGPTASDGLTIQNRRAMDSFVLSTGLTR